MQLVLTDRSDLMAGKDYGVFSPSTWRLADLSTKYALLREGIGWGSMPRHMVDTDVAEGRLVHLDAHQDFTLTSRPTRASLQSNPDTQINAVMRRGGHRPPHGKHRPPRGQRDGGRCPPYWPRTAMPSVFRRLITASIPSCWICEFTWLRYSVM